MSVEKEDPKNGDGTNSRSTRNEREWKIPFTSASISAPLLLTYSLSLLYNISFFIQMIILPYLAKQLEISDTDIGLIQTFFGVLQMIGGPIFGFLIRRFGIRKALILCYTSTIISSLLKFTSKFSLYVSIIPSIFMHGQQAHQTLLSMITTAGKERTNEIISFQLISRNAQTLH
ncbi:unnamed protein product [Anisakis simplex]|uniref:MFS domain-containing protein n=1 Tax=Anisakis simplex TaxID=6269 RepID=A0A0M3JD92_ANISI|nr:unnamed protein product [Anisakis simplex]